ncbi:MAG: 16S rRNA (cytosine(1402)-N(4))-methyltransferase RsmH [Armatimonas sp.]
MSYHIPVMLEECLEGLNLAPGKTIVDGTLGGGGHSASIAEALGAEGTLIGLDQDPDALEAAGARLANAPCQVHLVRTNFENLESALDSLGLALVHGILLDLGVSSHQLDTPGRGFALRMQGPLDMRMNPDVGETAAELLNRLSEREIAQILFEYGEERRSRQIAAQIVKSRPLTTTEDLVDCVRRAMPGGTRPGQIHPATRTFQGIRIAVNDELGVLERAIEAAVRRLASGGRVVVLSYHSLEDRIVKTAFNTLSGKREGSDFPDLTAPPEPVLSIVTKKPVGPSDDEVRRNPRARSARLRVAQKI